MVQGALSADWSDRLAGLAITTTLREDRAAHTTLVGPIRDQAELSGVLDTLYGLHLSILKVEKLEDEERDGQPRGPSRAGAGEEILMKRQTQCSRTRRMLPRSPRPGCAPQAETPASADGPPPRRRR